MIISVTGEGDELIRYIHYTVSYCGCSGKGDVWMRMREVKGQRGILAAEVVVGLSDASLDARRRLSLPTLAV